MVSERNRNESRRFKDAVRWYQEGEYLRNKVYDVRKVLDGIRNVLYVFKDVLSGSRNQHGKCHEHARHCWCKILGLSTYTVLS